MSYEIEPGLAAVGAIGEKALSAEDAGAARSAGKAFSSESSDRSGVGRGKAEFCLLLPAGRAMLSAILRFDSNILMSRASFSSEPWGVHPICLISSFPLSRQAVCGLG